MEINEENVRLVTLKLHQDDIRVLKKGGTIKMNVASITDVVFEICYEETTGT